METLAISKFKASCLAVLERVRQTGRLVVITRFGQPVAHVIPPPPTSGTARWLASFRATGEIVGDVVSPATDNEEWEVSRR